MRCVLTIARGCNVLSMDTVAVIGWDEEGCGVVPSAFTVAKYAVSILAEGDYMRVRSTSLPTLSAQRCDLDPTRIAT